MLSGTYFSGNFNTKTSVGITNSTFAFLNSIADSSAREGVGTKYNITFDESVSPTVLRNF